MKKKILFLGPKLVQGSGGVSIYIENILNVLRQNFKHQIECEHLTIGSNSNRRFHIITDQIRLFIRLLFNTYDVIHLNPSFVFKSFFRDGLFMLLCRIMNVPVIIMFHGWDDQFAEKASKRFNWFFQHSFAKARIITVLSEDFKKDLINKFNIEESRIRTETTCVNNKLFASVISDKEIDKDTEINILFLSRVIKEKGILELVEAFLSLRNKYKNINLFVAGKGDALNEAIKLDVKNNIHFLGYVSGNEKEELFSKAHVFCLPSSHGEGMPISILEAMYSGQAILTTPVGGVKYFFKEGSMGYFCKKSKEDIEEKLINLIIDVSRLKNI